MADYTSVDRFWFAGVPGSHPTPPRITPNESSTARYPARLPGR